VIISLNSINQFIFVMVKCGVLFEVRIEFSNILKTSVRIKGLIVMFMSVLAFFSFPDVNSQDVSDVLYWH
jgi:hypothetical protein